MATYNIQFTTTTSLPVKVRDAHVGVFGRVVTPDKHIGKLVMKLDNDTVICIDDAKAWSRFGNVRIEPLTPGESVIVTRDFEAYGFGVMGDLDGLDDEFSSEDDEF
jgi:hypothetical protein